MMPTIIIAALLALAAGCVVTKRVKDFKNHRYCSGCSGCGGKCRRQ